MTASEYISQNNYYLISQVQNIVRGHEEYMDLYQHVIEQILNKPEKMDVIPDDEKLYYFIRIVKTNWHSSTSPYQYQKRKYENKHTELFDFKAEQIVDEQNPETPTMEWVNKQLETMEWFDRDLFILWVELGTLTKVHKETTIPINSVGKYINNIKTELNKRWTNRH